MKWSIARKICRKISLHLNRIFMSKDKKSMSPFLDSTTDLHFEYGRYVPAFFCIKINTAHRLDNILELNEEVQPTFYHEYFHFLQNLTTPFGINSSWNSLDRIRRLIGHAQHEQQPIKLPLTGSMKVEMQEQNDALFALNSDGRLLRENPDAYEIVNLSLDLRPEFDKFSPQTKLRFLNLHLQNSEGNNANYWFGTFAVLESMTYMIQSKFFGDTSPPVYPYRIANRLVTYAQSQIANKDEFIFALCDVALLSNTPGRSFWDILLYLNRSGNELTNAEQVYELAFQFYSEHGYDVLKSFNDSKEGLLKMISQLYGHDIFSYDSEWLTTIIERAYELRRNSPMFMLHLYREPQPFSKTFIEVFTTIGTPDIVNLVGERWISLPVDMRHLHQKVNSIFMSVYYEWHETLLKEKSRCGLIDVCNAAEPNMPVNGNCKHSPWLKRDEEPICPYAAIMHVFGIEIKH